MQILTRQGLISVSVIIGICGANFCSFIADQRKVVWNGKEWTAENDTTPKIMKVNSSVMVGATGTFEIGEPLFGPFGHFDASKFMVDESVALLDNYIHEALLKATGAEHLRRGYMIGGKNRRGNFQMVEAVVDFKNKDVQYRTYLPTGKEFGVSLALPGDLENRRDKYMAQIQDILNERGRNPTTHKRAMQRIGRLVNKMSEIDNSVGGEPMMLTIT